MEQEHEDICSLRIEVARLDERINAASKALELARSSVSRAAIISVLTIIISVISIAVQWLKH